MQVFLVLLVLAVLVLVTLVGITISSLLLGGMLAATERARILAPVFLIVVPSTAIGALVGGILVGYLAVEANESAIFLGPLAGLIAGGAAGLSIGTAAALFWWWRKSRSRRVET